uniref:Transposase (putative) gypsy type domain-containing protein n=1 Tax=Fagus sylvatica TaxID=28930 RepID=A0A2N9HVM0_FAGSY
MNNIFLRFAENNLGPPPLEGYISSDSVLHRLAVELYSIVYPALSSWEGIRNRMAANEAEWSLPLSEELPEGLSDESPGRVTREDSSEATLEYIGRASVWLGRQIPDDVVLRIPDSDERACCPKYVGDVAFYEADLKAGLRFPIQPFVRELLDFLGLAPGQINPNGWRTIITCMVMWRVTSNGSEDLTVDELFFSKSLAKSHSPGAFGRLRTGMPTLGSFRGYRRLIGFGKTSTFLSAVTTGRDSHKKILGTLLESVGRGGPPYRLVVGSSVAEFGLAAEDFEDSGHRRSSVAAEPVVLKRKRAGEGSSRQTETIRPPPKETVPAVEDVPPVIMVDLDTNPPRDASAATVSQNPHLAMDRAKAAFTSKDMDDYAAAHTDDVHYLLVHSLMRGLNEAMVMSKRCLAVEEEIATLRAKYMVDEAEMKNAKRAVLELTRERRDALDEADKLKKELKARDDDVKAAVDAKDKAVAELKHLVAFRKQAVQRFPGLDFSSLQPYDDTDSVADVSQDQAGDDDVSSKQTS